MNDAAIRIENLSKRYRIGETVPYRTLRESLSRGLSAPLRRLWGGGRGRSGSMDPSGQTGEIWALRDVSLEIPRGQVVGIIGNNGAGKSTLLKILSRITQPSAGRAEIRGRVGSLLEVGTGFHTELTGRENVYLNGAILGMRRSETAARFDEIVAFSQVEKFLDTPVKRYSSGMRVRLAFAVAAHLEPEILIIDEVLAVGDAAFQKKCLGKMNDVARQGRTVLFVSHNLNAVANLCSRAVWLREGAVAEDGPTGDTIRAYLDSVQAAARSLCRGNAGRYDLRAAPRDGVEARSRARVFESLSIRDGRGQLTDVVCAGDPISFEIRYAHDEPLARPMLGIVVSKPQLGRVAFLHTLLQHGPIDKLPASGSIVCRVPRLPLAPGTYTLSFGASTSGEQLDWVEHCVELQVQPADFYGTGHLPAGNQGVVLVDAEWSTP
jgi:lipopolysaccharide transport system ATP-binding protein